MKWRNGDRDITSGMGRGTSLLEWGEGRHF